MLCPMFSPASSAAARSLVQAGFLSPEGKALTITCRGCGQVGAIAVDLRDDGRNRRDGFYLHGTGNGTPVVACCKCQQIQPCDGNGRDADGQDRRLGES